MSAPIPGGSHANDVQVYYSTDGTPAGLVPRREVPEVLAGSQPQPLWTDPDDNLIFRLWAPGATRHCRLCPTCHARHNPALGLDGCVVDSIVALETGAEAAAFAYHHAGLDGQPVPWSRAAWMAFPVQEDLDEAFVEEMAELIGRPLPCPGIIGSRSS